MNKEIVIKNPNEPATNAQKKVIGHAVKENRYPRFSPDKWQALTKGEASQIITELYGTEDIPASDAQKKKLADLTNQMEQACYDDMTFIPVYQSQSFGMQSERIRPAMSYYVPGYGWGYMWGDLVQ